MRIKFTVLFCFLSSYLFAQQPYWEKYLGGSGFDAGKKIINTTDGNFVIGGEVASTDGIGTGNAGDADVVILKYSPTGDMLWATRLGGSGAEDFGDIIQTADGGYAMIGTTESPDGELHSLYGKMDLFLTKFNDRGVLQWKQYYGGSGNDRGFTLLEMYDGGFMIAGEAGSRNGIMLMPPLGGLDGWIARTDPKGKLIWERRYGGGGNEHINSLIPLAGDIENFTKHYMVVATTSSQDNQVNENNGGNDIWVFNIDEFGRFVGWQQSFGGEADEDVHVAKLNVSDSTIVLGGTTFSTRGDIPLQRGLGDMWFFKIDMRGKLIFSQTYGGSKQEGLSDFAQTTDGGYVLAGMTASRDGIVLNNNGSYDGLLVKTDAEGNLKVIRTAGYEKKDFFYGVVENPKGGYLCIGSSELGINNTQLIEHNGSYDIWACAYNDKAEIKVSPPTLSGRITDKKTGKPMKVYLKLTNNANLDSLQAVSTNPDDGRYIMVLPTSGEVSIGTLKPGYFFYGEDLEVSTIAMRPNVVITRNIALEPLTIGASTNLARIHFPPATPSPTPNSYSEMERLVTFMKLNPKVEILLEGHASYENDGVDKDNLSKLRADAVKEYLVKKGIKAFRIQTKGAGVSQQLEMDTREDLQAKNRRVKMVILAM